MNWTLIKFLLVPLGLGQVAGLLTSTDILKWYVPKLKKPSYVPPAPVFGAVWPVMYGLMGYASYLVFKQGGFQLQAGPLNWYALQLGLNVSWQLLFFKVRNLGFAQLWNVGLLGAVAYTTKLFGAVDPLAGKLMLPYLAWTAFANVINFGVWRSNPQVPGDAEDEPSTPSSGRSSSGPGYPAGGFPAGVTPPKACLQSSGPSNRTSRPLRTVAHISHPVFKGHMGSRTGAGAGRMSGFARGTAPLPVRKLACPARAAVYTSPRMAFV